MFFFNLNQGAIIQILGEAGGVGCGAGYFKLDKLFISSPVCNYFIYFTLYPQGNYLFHFFFEFTVSVYKVCSQARRMCGR